MLRLLYCAAVQRDSLDAFPGVVALERCLLGETEALRSKASCPHLCRRPRPVSRATAAARMEGEAGPQRGFESFPRPFVRAARNGEIEARIDHRRAAARTRMFSGR